MHGLERVRWGSRRSRRSSASTPSCSLGCSWRDRPGCGCCRSRSWGNACCSRSTLELAAEFPITGVALPVEPPAARRRIRLVQRLGRGVGLRGRQHHNRLPRGPVGARAARDRGHAVGPRRYGMVLVVVCARLAPPASACSSGPCRGASSPRRRRSWEIGLPLLLVFREHDFSLLTETLGAEAASGSVAAGMFAALAVGGWVFIGFDACVAGAEETRDAARHVRVRSGSRSSPWRPS